MISKKIISAFVLILITLSVHTQRNALFVFTPSPYSLNDQPIFSLDFSATPVNLSFSGIEVIDNRYDTTKQGFFPVYKNAPKQLIFNTRLSVWLKSQLDGFIKTNTKTERRLVVVIQRFWFNTLAEQKFTPFKQQLLTSLYYKLELFSFTHGNYFPLKRYEGNLRTGFREQDTYKPLLDSTLESIYSDLPSINLQQKEETKNAITTEKFNEYIERKAVKINARRIKNGVYASFEDFVNQKIIGDSVDIIRYNDYYGRQMVACQLGVYVHNFLQSCNKYWGYFDGRFLFFNTGNGLFVKLIPWNNQFILADLQQIVYSKKRKSFVTESYISTTPYSIVKDFAKAYHLFFQLDYDDGKLY